MILERVSNSTATTVIADWTILNLETCQVVAVAKHRELKLKVVKEIAPNLAHWSNDSDLQTLLDQCTASGEADESDTTNLDRLGRRKRVPVVDFVDNLMSIRLGLSIDTIRSYRQRGLRAAEREMKEDRVQGGDRSELPKS